MYIMTDIYGICTIDMYCIYVLYIARYLVVAKELPLPLHCKHFPPNVVGKVAKLAAQIHTHTQAYTHAFTHTCTHTPALVAVPALLCALPVVHLPLQIRILTP